MSRCWWGRRRLFQHQLVPYQILSLVVLSIHFVHFFVLLESVLIQNLIKMFLFVEVEILLK